MQNARVVEHMHAVPTAGAKGSTGVNNLRDSRDRHGEAGTGCTGLPVQGRTRRIELTFAPVCTALRAALPRPRYRTRLAPLCLSLDRGLSKALRARGRRGAVAALVSGEYSGQVCLYDGNPG